MEFLQLKYFKEVAELQHITEAAKKLHIAQPALSKVIKSLETELGVLLFDRIGKNIYLNENGKILLKYTYDIFSSLDNAEREIKSSSKFIQQTITLSMRAASKLLPDLLSKFKQRHPDIRFEITLHEHTDTKQSPWDLCINSTLEPPMGNNSIVLLKEDLYFALPSNHRLAKQDEIQLKDISAEPFISFHKDSSLSNITTILCNRAGFKPNIVLESDDPATIRGLINMGLGVSFIPNITWKGFADSNIRLLRIADIPCQRYITLTTSEQRYLSKSVLTFKEYLIDYFYKLN